MAYTPQSPRAGRTPRRPAGSREDRPAGGSRPRRSNSYDVERAERHSARPSRDTGRFERPERPERRFNREDREGRPSRPARSAGHFDRDDRPARFERRRPAPRAKSADTPERAAAKKSGAIRLNRYIALSGVCSRREADELIATGAVTVNGQICTVMGTLVQPEDKVVVGGQRLKAEKKVYLLMNKPKGYITTLDDPQQRHTVMELIKDACSERIYPVGRLDRNTTGVLLFTNDGDLAKKLTHPSHGARKIYHVGLDKPFAKADMEALLKGLTLEDGPVEVDDAEYVEDSHRKEVGVQIHSGRNRIVRRMFEHLGYTVCKLDRVLFAELTKKNLARGEWRFLTENEVRFLKMNV
ncbi:MAG: pseudouridine synthase [Bacteroidales bacterium]|nr:pseudouridine synthase [Bacteroidales bacterium]